MKPVTCQISKRYDYLNQLCQQASGGFGTSWDRIGMEPQKITTSQIWKVKIWKNGWPRWTIGHLFCTTSSFVHHVKAIGEFKLELQSGNAQFGSKLVSVLSCPTLKFDRWLLITIRHFFYATSSFVHHFIAICEFKLERLSGNAQFRSKLTIFLVVWPCNLTDELEK